MTCYVVKLTYNSIFVIH